MKRHPISRLIQASISAMLTASLMVGSTVVAQQSGEGTDGNSYFSAGVTANTYDSAVASGLAPDENAKTNTKASSQSANQTFSYYMISGATLRGRSSTIAYTYNAQGCTFLSAGAGAGLILNTELQIPDGSVIKYLRLYYNDTTNTGSARGFLTRYTPGQATNDLVGATSTTAFDSGVGYVVSSEITETVNNAQHAYTLIGWPTAAGSALQICGLRIAYYAPATAASTYIPNVNKAP